MKKILIVDVPDVKNPENIIFQVRGLLEPDPDGGGWGYVNCDFIQVDGKCEWNKSSLLNHWYCECNDDAPSIPNHKFIEFKYCPYCGKEIERNN